MQAVHNIVVYAALALMLSLWVGVVCFRGWQIARRQGVAFLLLAACFLHAMANKPPAPTTRPVEFPRTDPEVAYLTDAGSYVSNNFVHVAFTTLLVPNDADIQVAYCPLDSTNAADVVTYYQAALGAFPRPLDFEFEGAISNRWFCFTTWTPGPAVYTNGVWRSTWMTDRRQNRYLIPIRTPIILDGATIAPPARRGGSENLLTTLANDLNGGNANE